MKKYTSVLIIIVIVIGAFSLLADRDNRTAIVSLFTSNKSTSFVFVGDIMLSRQIEKIVYREEDPLYHFLISSDVTKSADITFGNLEGPVSLRGEDQGSLYSFRMNPDLLQGLVYGGFDIVSIANNHSFDWGRVAYSDTMKHLKEKGIAYTGGGATYYEGHRATKLERNGETFCFLGYTEFAYESVSNRDAKPEMNKISLDIIRKDIESAKKDSCGPIIVSLHWGTEYEVHPSPEQKEIAHAIIDAGALMVIGHHPHVIQDVERYNGGLIAYSLGNFVFDQNFSFETKKGLLLKVVVAGGKIQSVEQNIVRFTDTFQPVPEKKE